MTKKNYQQAGGELGQAQAKFELLMKFNLALQLELTTSPGGCWVGAGFYEINAKPSSIQAFNFSLNSTLCTMFNGQDQFLIFVKGHDH